MITPYTCLKYYFILTKQPIIPFVISLASAQINTSTTKMLKKRLTEVLASANGEEILHVYFSN